MPLQPYLHDLSITLAAPTQVLSDRIGEILADADHPTAEGVVHADVRVISRLELLVGGLPGEHLTTRQGTGSATYIAALRGFDAADGAFRLDRTRQVTPGRVAETMIIRGRPDADLETTAELIMASDLAEIDVFRSGRASEPYDFAQATVEDDSISWAAGSVTATLQAPGATVSIKAAEVRLRWPIDLPAGEVAEFGWSLDISDQGGAVAPARSAGLPVEDILDRYRSIPDPRLGPWLRRALEDLNGLRMTLPDSPDRPFFAAGAPWFYTLFGRDSIWTARFLLPVDVDHARGTLLTLAASQGSKVDIVTAEQPGKIMHELRRSDRVDGWLPPLYYGTVDATPLWISLLRDAHTAGLEDETVRTLLPNLQRAVEWLLQHADADGDGFIEYIDESGQGLANQGWKDSGDSIRFADGTIADGPIALCEVQGYAYEAAIAAAELYQAYGLSGDEELRSWAATLQDRFRTSFWVGPPGDRYPALALDGEKRPVDSPTSNIGHLLGTGILTADESELVARRLISEDFDSGLGLRTMAATSRGYTPQSYHCGSVWPHDTAIVIAGLLRSGHRGLARDLVEGLIRASLIFDGRLPELWSGEGEPGVPYPAACRPQAWSAAAAIVVAEVLR